MRDLLEVAATNDMNCDGGNPGSEARLRAMKGDGNMSFELKRFILL